MKERKRKVPVVQEGARTKRKGPICTLLVLSYLLSSYAIRGHAMC